MRTLAYGMLALGLCGSVVARTQDNDYGLALTVQQADNTFTTQASFQLPLTLCQAWRYITNYDAAVQIPGIVSSRTTRIGNNRARVDREMKDTILFFPIRMRTVMDYKEMVNQGTDFVQIEGPAKTFQGSWRLTPKSNGTVFEYQSVSEPDSALPMAVIRYFLDRRLRDSFAAMARHGATQDQQPCD